MKQEKRQRKIAARIRNLLKSNILKETESMITDSFPDAYYFALGDIMGVAEELVRLRLDQLGITTTEKEREDLFFEKLQVNFGWKIQCSHTFDKLAALSEAELLNALSSVRESANSLD